MEKEELDCKIFITKTITKKGFQQLGLNIYERTLNNTQQIRINCTDSIYFVREVLPSQNGIPIPVTNLSDLPPNENGEIQYNNQPIHLTCFDSEFNIQGMIEYLNSIT